MSVRAPRTHRDVVGALAIWCFSLQGLALSLLLTGLKFRADSLCDDDILGACPLGATSSCATVLTDAWSVLLGAPLTVYSAAFYLVTGGLALLTVTGAGLRRYTRPLLLVSAWSAAAVTVAFAARASLWLGALCTYCLFLYLVQLGILVAARLMNPEGLRGAARQARGMPRILPRTLAVAGLAALVFVTAANVGRAVLRRASAHTLQHSLTPCEVRLSQIPDSALVLPASTSPRLIAAVFIDLACPHCRDEFEFWPRFQAGAPWPIEVRYFHFPATSCDVEALAAGAPDLSPQRSCDGARALHCMMKLGAPGRGLDMTEALFSAQTGAGPYFAPERLAMVAREFDIEADPGRLAAEDPLFGCMIDPQTTDALVRDMRFAQDVAELDRPPGALLIPLDAGQPFGRAQQVRGHKPQATLEAWISALLTAPPEPG